MHALFLPCSLEPGSESSNTQALADVVLDALRGNDLEATSVRVVDRTIPPGVRTDMGEGAVARALQANPIPAV